jgi:hypothetical protein
VNERPGTGCFVPVPQTLYQLMQENTEPSRTMCKRVPEKRALGERASGGLGVGLAGAALPQGIKRGGGSNAVPDPFGDKGLGGARCLKW